MVARVIREVIKRAPKRVKKVTRTAKGKRADLRAERLEQRKGNTRTRFVNEKVKTKPPGKGPVKPPKPPGKGDVKPKPPVKPKGGTADKAAKKSLLRKYGIPLGVISSILAGSTLLNKNEKVAKKVVAKPVAKKVVAKPAAKKEEPMKRRFRAGPTAGSGLGGQRRSGTLRGKNVVANPPKPRNKDTAKRPKRPSKQGSFGR
jgi:hypothetical protein